MCFTASKQKALVVTALCILFAGLLNPSSATAGSGSRGPGALSANMTATTARVQRFKIEYYEAEAKRTRLDAKQKALVADLISESVMTVTAAVTSLFVPSLALEALVSLTATIVTARDLATADIE